MPIHDILDDITSRDPHKVWSSACQIIEMAQFREQIEPLIQHLDQIKEKTAGLEMGGAFASNQRFVDYAIKIIEFHKNSTACTCELYADKYECNNPEKEEEKGNIRIESRTRIQEQWIEFYFVSCTTCQQKFKITEGEGHYTWWEWAKLHG